MIPARTDAGPTATDDFLKGIWRENPVLVQVLGTCPTLAVTNTARNAVAMGLATLFVLLGSNAIISAIRRFVPKQVRIASYILVIASLVTIVDYAIQAISLEVHKALGAFIALIVVNCIILGRAEAFASRHDPARAALDGFATGTGFLAVLLLIGMLREGIGEGSLFAGAGELLGLGWLEMSVEGYPGFLLAMLPMGAFLVLAALVALRQGWRQRHEGRE